MEIKYKDSNSFQILVPCLVMTILVVLIYFFKESISYSVWLSMLLSKCVMIGVYYCIFVHAPRTMYALYIRKKQKDN